MKTLMRTRRLLSFGASKIATAHAQRANEQVRQAQQNAMDKDRVTAELLNYGRSKYVFPARP